MHPVRRVLERLPGVSECERARVRRRVFGANGQGAHALAFGRSTKAQIFPYGSSLCRACNDACPVQIPLGRFDRPPARRLAGAEAAAVVLADVGVRVVDTARLPRDAPQSRAIGWRAGATATRNRRANRSVNVGNASTDDRRVRGTLARQRVRGARPGRARRRARPRDRTSPGPRRDGRRERRRAASRRRSRTRDRRRAATPTSASPARTSPSPNRPRSRSPPRPDRRAATSLVPPAHIVRRSGRSTSCRHWPTPWRASPPLPCRVRSPGSAARVARAIWR